MGREAYPEVHEAHPAVWERLVIPPGGQGGDGRGQEAHPVVQEGSGGPPEGQGGVWWPIRRSRRGREYHPEVQERSGGPPKGTEGVWRGQEAHP